MFNGIIYNQGKVKKLILKKKVNLFLYILKYQLNKKNKGMSISCDGVCLTLSFYKKKF